MKKISLLLVVAGLAAAPAAAAPKQKMLTYEEAMKQNQKSFQLVVEGLPLVLPSWALPFYFGMQKNKAQQGAKKKKR
jgi:hypothetical protein